MDGAADGLGRTGEPQVGANRGGRRNAEYEDEDRRHQRAPADSGEADEKADEETRKGVRQVHRQQLARAKGLGERALVQCFGFRSSADFASGPG